MDELRKQIGFSFKDMEQALWSVMLEEFGKLLSEFLNRLDERLFTLRDRRRYASHDRVERMLGTLFGRDVCFTRRRYRDRQTGKDVYLLDEVLGIKADSQVSPGLMALMLTQTATTNSYRKAAEGISSFLGFHAVSHETIRQAVIQLGEEMERSGADKRQNPQGRRKTNVLFLEADGMWVPLQRWEKRRLEEKIFTSHEGWQPRYRGSKEYRLKHLRQFRTHHTGDVWEEASRWAYTHYDIDENTVVVINGDRAGWIRNGVNYFPNAMYQIDRFHLVRDLKRLFNKGTKTYRLLLEALHGDDATGAAFIARLAEAKATLRDERKREEARSLLHDLSEMPEATVDYRVRLRALGVPTKGLQGAGATEAQVARFSGRIKGRRSWRPRGLSAMMELQRTRHEGVFGDIIDRLEQWALEEGESLKAATAAVRKAVRAVATRVSDALGADVPIKQVGVTASGGMSNFFHRLDEGGMPSYT